MPKDTRSTVDQEFRERQHQPWRFKREEHLPAFLEAIRGSREHRDMAESLNSGGGYFVPEEFYYMITAMMKQMDRLFDPSVVLFIESDSGAPMTLPLIDDTGVSAVIVTEGDQSSTADISVGRQKLALAPTWRSQMIKTSIELIQDSAFPLAQEFVEHFAKRLARGIGAANVAQLLTSATLGVTASGASANDGGGETGGTSIGSDDLESLLSSVDQAYRMSPKCRWAMNSSTLMTLHKVKDKVGFPVFPRERNAAGEPLLLDYPVAVCPSMPSIGLSNVPILFGDFGRFIVRVVKDSARLKTSTERFAEYGEVTYEMFLRSNAALALPSGSDSPIKYLQNASA